MTSGVKLLGDMVPIARACREESFVQRYPQPFLLGKEVQEEEFNFQTCVAKSVDEPRKDPPRDDGRIRDWVLPLQKAGAQGGVNRIFLGRASNNDLVVPHPTVSKLHAYFVKENDRWWLVDVGSCNGTKVNGVKAPARAKVGLNDGDLIIFGKCAFHFISASRLYSALSRLTSR